MNSTEDSELRDFVGFLESLKNYDSGEGFDLGRMKRLMLRLHNPHFKYKVILGGPFLPHIEGILRSKAASMSSPVMLASDIGSGSSIKGVINKNGIGLCQSCDIVIQNGKEDKPIAELGNVNLRMLGDHQLQNAVTATCVSLCLRIQAHTKESAGALKEMIKKDFAEKRFVLVVATASDKDHVAFGKELLSGLKPEAVVETACSVLKKSWIKAADGLGLGFVEASENKTVLGSLELAHKILKHNTTGDAGMVIVTGSLHIVSSVLASLQH